MTSYLNSLSGHVANLKRLIPHSLTPESDLSITDTEDSHVSRVLRAYYTEKGRPIPLWLGPDPRQPQQAAPVFANNGPQRGEGTAIVGMNSRTGRGLGDLFGDSAPAAPAVQEPMSLRQARRPAAGRSPAPAVAHGYQETTPSARPLPSQRAGSYQTRPSGIPTNNSSLVPETELQRAPSAQNRLKARFGAGARSGSAQATRAQSPGAAANSPWQGADTYDSRNGRRW